MKLQKVLTFIALAFIARLAYAQPVVIDGTFDPAEWAGATVYPLSVNIPGGGTTSGELHLKNDATNLYLAVRYKRPALDIGSSVGLRIDANRDGMIHKYDDAVVVAIDISSGCSLTKAFFDSFYSNLPGCPAGAACGYDDSVGGGTTDGNGAVGNDGYWSTHEIWHPLASADIANDMQFRSGETIGFDVHIRLLDTAGTIFDTYHPGPGVLETYTIH